MTFKSVVPPDPGLLLTEATLEQIFASLAGRYDCCLFACVSSLGRASEKFRMLYSGGPIAGAGLAQVARTEMVKKVLDSTSMGDEGEDCR